MPTNLFTNPPAIKDTKPKNLFDGLEKTNITKPVNDQVAEHPLFKTTNGKGQLGVDIANAVTSSEQNFGKDIGQAGFLLFGGQKKIDKITQQYMDNGHKMTELAKKQADPTLKQKYSQMAIDSYKQAQKVGGDIIGNTRTPEQIVGDALGVATDVALAGSYNPEAKSFELLNAADKAKLAQNGIKAAGAYNALSTADKLKFLGKETLKATAKGAGVGYSIDVSKNLQNNKPLSEAVKPGLTTAIGAAVPLVIGGIKITATALRNPDTAGRVVNSLIKPLQKDFAYGKDPGKVIAQEGITANSLDELGNKVNEKRQQIGQQLGEATSSLEGKTSLDLTDMTKPIDQAIADAKKSPRTNASIIERLMSIKNDLLGVPVETTLSNSAATHGLEDIAQSFDTGGIGKVTNPDLANKIRNIELPDITDPKQFENAVKNSLTREELMTPGMLQRIKENVAEIKHFFDNPDEYTPMLKQAPDLSGVTFQDAINMKGTVGDLTKWTGNPSDDKIVNKALKQVYGTINQEVISKAQQADPSIAANMSELNDKYGSLLSAQNAIKHRDMILQRQNLISMPVKVGTVTGLITALGTGGAAIPAILSGVSAGVLDKALQSTTVKTRLASWLAKEAPDVIEKLYQANPAIRNILIKAVSSSK